MSAEGDKPPPYDGVRIQTVGLPDELSAEGDEPPSYGWALSPAVVLPSPPFALLALTFEMENVKESDCQPCVRTPVSDVSGL